MGGGGRACLRACVGWGGGRRREWYAGKKRIPVNYQRLCSRDSSVVRATDS